VGTTGPTGSLTNAIQANSVTMFNDLLSYPDFAPAQMAPTANFSMQDPASDAVGHFFCSGAQQLWVGNCVNLAQVSGLRVSMRVKFAGDLSAVTPAVFDLVSFLNVSNNREYRVRLAQVGSGNPTFSWQLLDPLMGLAIPGPQLVAPTYVTTPYPSYYESSWLLVSIDYVPSQPLAVGINNVPLGTFPTVPLPFVDMLWHAILTNPDQFVVVDSIYYKLDRLTPILL
jgi:hypothetical protein